MFKGYTEAGSHHETLVLFDRMRRRGVGPNRYTFTFVLKSCAKVAALRKGEEVHCFSVKSGFGSNMFVGTALVDVYSAGGEVGSACKVFEEMPCRNVVAWTAIVTAYVSSGDLVSARKLFDLVEDRDIVIWNTMVSGYLKVGDMDAARELFDRMQDRDLMCWNTMLHGYANGADLEACVRFFEVMPERNAFSWNGLIAGYVYHNCFSEALHALNRMLKEPDVRPNEATLVTVLSACSKLGALDMGRWIHVYAYGNGFRGSTNVGNGLVDMYAKCGSIDTATDIFYGMGTRDVISWNTIIGGLAMHGCGSQSLSLFDQMKKAGQMPDGITFVGVLCACSHMGLVQEGFAYFRSMVEEYAISPWIEHYGCMVDLLGRSGLLNEALDLIRRMPMEADCVIWSSLLGACQTYGDVGMAEIAVKQLMRLQPEDAANYVALSNIYGSVGRWKDVAIAKYKMREKTAGKLPGCSLIELNHEVVEFYSSDVKHKEAEEIYRTLEELTKLSKLVESDGALDSQNLEENETRGNRRSYHSC